MKILVTGATGLIGAHSTVALLRAGFLVRSFVRNAEKLNRILAPFGFGEEDVEVVVGALDDSAAIEKALNGCDGLLHCAGIFSPDPDAAELLHKTNVEGTRLVLEAAASAQLERIVYVSSILALFPPVSDVMRAEDAVAEPSEMYAATKAAAERIARAHQASMPLTILYPGAVQGPDDPTFSIGPQLVANALIDGRVLVTEGGLPTTDVRDLAEIVRAVFEGRAESDRVMGPAFFLRHERYHSLLESLTGRDLAAQKMPGWMLRILGRLGDLAARLGRPVQLTSEAAAVLTRSVPVDDAEACRLLGRAPISDEASFRDLIDWMVRAGHLDSAAAGRAAPKAKD